MFENEVMDRYMHCIMQNLKKNAQVCIYSLADLNIGHCVEFQVTFDNYNVINLYIHFSYIFFVSAYFNIKQEDGYFLQADREPKEEQT